MKKLLGVSVFVLIVAMLSYVQGYNRGDEQVRIDVFKNCLAANLDPKVCLQYMEIIKNREYLYISPAKKTDM